MTVETGHAIFQEHVPFNKLEMNTQLFWIARNYIKERLNNVFGCADVAA